MKKPSEAIEEAIAKCGGAAKLARLVGVKPPVVTDWRKGNRPVSAKRALIIERELGINRKDLCPSVFAEET